MTSKSSSKNALELQVRQPQALDYLMNGHESKEKVKSFINFSRQILMSQISINTKREENERLKEYITMEQEKLDECKKFLEQDQLKFEKLMNDAEEEAKAVADKVKEKAKEKKELKQ